MHTVLICTWQREKLRQPRGTVIALVLKKCFWKEGRNEGSSHAEADGGGAQRVLIIISEELPMTHLQGSQFLGERVQPVGANRIFTEIPTFSYSGFLLHGQVEWMESLC